MRTFNLWRFTALLLIIGSMLAAPELLATHTFDGGDSVAVAADKEKPGKDDKGKDKGDKQDDKDQKEREKEEKRQEKEDRKDNKPDKKDKPNPVEPAAGYGVDVACTVAADATSTECSFTSVAPAGGKKVSNLVIPEGEICAGILDGDFDRVDPDPATNVTGYRATGNDLYTLTLEGQVTTGGATTYWVEAANEVLPATGPRLVCAEPAASTIPEATLESTTEAPLEATLEVIPEEATTGTVTVSTYACTGVPADTSAYDWYGACDAGGDHRFVLAPTADDSTGPLAADTAKTGEATFADLPPGLYDLDDVNANWCHAESDAVNAEGDVMVEAGVETTVWLFYCHDGGS